MEISCANLIYIYIHIFSNKSYFAIGKYSFIFHTYSYNFHLFFHLSISFPTSPKHKETKKKIAKNKLNVLGLEATSGNIIFQK